MLSTDIKLPRSAEPVFPDRCVVCRKPQPGGRTRVRRTAASWWGAVIPILHLVSLFDGHVAHVPACSGCGLKLHAQAWWRFLAMIAIAIVFVWLGAEVVGPWVPRPLLKWVMIAATLLALLPWFVWQVLFPLAFDMTVETEEVTYEFANPQYAVDFSLINSQHEVMHRYAMVD